MGRANTVAASSSSTEAPLTRSTNTVTTAPTENSTPSTTMGISHGCRRGRGMGPLTTLASDTRHLCTEM
ncbi:hypothetical protein Lfu02_60930 [Longispora fulva]|nr:hypothetical protein Lfu02_60930 [Longispora fulva]